MDKMVKNTLLETFKNKRVLVTGDTGFKGSWLCLWLHQLGARVGGFALPPQRDEDHFNVLGLKKIISHTDGDIRDFSKVNKIFIDFQPEFLFHLAAQPIVKLAYNDPKYTFDTNIGGAVNILEAARSSSSLKSIVFITSDKCYRNKEWIWGYRENDEIGGYDPYSASKAATEIIFSSYLESFLNKMPHLGAASVRAGNVIGGGDWSPYRIIPDCIRSLKKNEVIVLRSADSTRPWQHLLEPLYGYMLCAINLYQNPEKFSGAWNFGPDTSTKKSVLELTKKVIECWGKGTFELVKQDTTAHEANLLQLNCDKAHHYLKWFPQWNFDRAVTETVSWYKEVFQGKPALEISKRQINNYSEGL